MNKNYKELWNEIIFKSDIFWGNFFDIALILSIMSSVIINILDSIVLTKKKPFFVLNMVPNYITKGIFMLKMKSIVFTMMIYFSTLFYSLTVNAKTQGIKPTLSIKAEKDNKTIIKSPEAKKTEEKNNKSPIPKQTEEKKKTEKGSPVIFKEEVLFYIHTGTELLTPLDRANIVTSRLKKIAENPNIDIESIKLTKDNNNINIYADKILIMTITEEDAKISGVSRQELGYNYKTKISDSLKKIRKDFNLQSILLGLAFTLIATIILIIIIKIIYIIFPKINQKLEKMGNENLIPSFKIQKLEIINSKNLVLFFSQIIGLFKIFLIILLLYIYIPLVLNFFPWTKGLADVLFGYITSPIKNTFYSILNFIPNIFNIAVILVVTYYFTKLTRLIFNAIENNTISINGFHEDWVETTYKMVRFLIIAFSAIMIFPYLPGSSSPAFQGVSVFMGLLISFGSGSAISNMVAGIVLRYTNAFKIGDRVKISDTIGDVVEKNLLVTRVRTIKNVDITIPNSSVLSSHIINYSSVANEKGLILHTTITIGYDVPWKKVHKALFDSALATSEILDEPKAFVLQTSLDDFYVSYQINAYTNNSHAMSRIYSELHQNIQDKCNEADIEIMSPHYSAVRDGNMTTIPQNYLGEDYKIPSFRI